MKTLLVDDEFLALNLLEKYLSELPDIEIVGKAKTPLAALEILNSGQVDLLFLDIQMPVLSGTNLLKTLRFQPATIFTTAYAEHAVEAFELNAVDYLLKPFSFERFLQAVNKARQFLQKNPVQPTGQIQNLLSEISKNSDLEPENFMSVKVDGRLEKIFFHEILYIEGLREYVRIVTAAKNFVVLESMKNLENTLPARNFLRVHKSYIVSKSKTQTLDGNQLVIGKMKIPISREKRDEVVRAIFGV